MKKRFLFRSFLLILMAATLNSSTCKDDDPDKVTVSTNSVDLSSGGGSQSIQVLSNTKWTISGNPSWLQVTPMQGSGDGSFSISASANTETNSRNCTLFINAGDASTVVSVNQQGAPAPVPSTTITITNNSSNSFMPLYIRFRNSGGEILHTEDLGDLHPGGVKSAQIPGSSASWFLITSSGNTVYYTADHLISETTFTITNATTWYYN